MHNIMAEIYFMSSPSQCVAITDKLCIHQTRVFLYWPGGVLFQLSISNSVYCVCFKIKRSDPNGSMNLKLPSLTGTNWIISKYFLTLTLHLYINTLDTFILTSQHTNCPILCVQPCNPSLLFLCQYTVVFTCSNKTEFPFPHCSCRSQGMHVKKQSLQI